MARIYRHAGGFLSVYLLSFLAGASPCLAESLQSYETRLKGLAASDNYLGDLFHEWVDCWPASRMPIKVYVHPTDNVEGYKPQNLDILKNGLQQWTDATGSKVSFTIVDARPEDGIEVFWKASAEHGQREVQEGVSNIFCDRDGIKRATVEVFTFPKDPDLRNADCVTLLGCIHEVGHALGLQGHSKVEADLMYPSYHLSFQAPAETIKLTDRDKRTIVALLNLGPKHDENMTAVEGIVELNNAAVTDINKSNFQAAIVKLEQCIHKDPTYRLAMDNLEVCYTNYALQKYQAKNYDETARLLEKRLACLDKEEKPNKAKLIETLTVYTYCMGQINKSDEAKQAQDRLDKLQAGKAK